MRFEHACNTERTDSLDSGISDTEYTTDVDGPIDCLTVDPRLDEIKKIARLLISGHRTILFSDWKVVSGNVSFENDAKDGGPYLRTTSNSLRRHFEKAER